MLEFSTHTILQVFIPYFRLGDKESFALNLNPSKLSPFPSSGTDIIQGKHSSKVQKIGRAHV